MRTVLGDDVTGSAWRRCSRRRCPARRASTTATRSAWPAATTRTAAARSRGTRRAGMRALRAFVRGLLRLRAAEPALRAGCRPWSSARPAAPSPSSVGRRHACSSSRSTPATSRSDSTSALAGRPATARRLEPIDLAGADWTGRSVGDADRRRCRGELELGPRSGSVLRLRLSAPPYTPRFVADLPIELDADLAERLARALDVEGKIPRALEALGPSRTRRPARRRDADGIRARSCASSARGSPSACAPTDAGPTRRADVVVGCWTAFRGARPDGDRRGGARPAARAAGSWSSTTTAATTSRACAATCPSTGCGAGATGRSCAAGSRSGSSTASGRSTRSRTDGPSSTTRSARWGASWAAG